MGGAVQRRRAEDLTEPDLARARIRQEHLLEVETGHRSGSRFWACPDEPRPGFDPALTTLAERRLAKVRELRASTTASPGLSMYLTARAKYSAESQELPVDDPSTGHFYRHLQSELSDYTRKVLVPTGYQP